MNTRIRHSGFTILELVVSISLFVIIGAILYSMLDAATNLWPVGSDTTQERVKIDRALDIIERDLQEAITDNGNLIVVSAGSSEDGLSTESEFAEIEPDKDEPAFLQGDLSEIDFTATTDEKVYQVLTFARPASYRYNTDLEPEDRLSIDVVCYTYYRNSLFRHQLPIERQTSNEQTKPLGELIYKTVREAKLDEICKALVEDPTGQKMEGYEGQHSRLLQRVSGLTVTSTIPYRYLLDPDSDDEDQTETEQGKKLVEATQHTHVEANVLPTRVDIGIAIQSEHDWNQWLQLATADDTDSQADAAAMGVIASRRIVLTTYGGSRL